MDKNDAWLMPSALFLGLIGSAYIIAGSLKQPEPAEQPSPSRFSLQQTFDDGWQVFDSATGRLCSVPNAKATNMGIECTNKIPD